MRRFLIAVLFCALSIDAFADAGGSGGGTLPTGGGSPSSTDAKDEPPAGQANVANVPAAETAPISNVVANSFPTMDIISLSRLGMESTDLDNLAADTNSKAALQRIALALADPGVASGVNDAIVDTRAKTSLVLAAREQLFTMMPILGANQEVLREYLACEAKNIREKNINAFDVVRFCMQRISTSGVATGADASALLPTGTPSPSAASGTPEQAIAQEINKNTSTWIDPPAAYQCGVDDLELTTQEKARFLKENKWPVDVKGARASFVLGNVSRLPDDKLAVEPTNFQKTFNDNIGDACVFKKPEGNIVLFIAPALTKIVDPTSPPEPIIDRYMRRVYDNIISLMKLKCLKEYGEPATPKLKLTKAGLFPATVYKEFSLSGGNPSAFWTSDWVNEKWLQRMSYAGFKFGPVAGNALFNELTDNQHLKALGNWAEADKMCNDTFAQYDSHFRTIVDNVRAIPDNEYQNFPRASIMLIRAVSFIATGRLASYISEVNNALVSPSQSNSQGADYFQYLRYALQHRAQRSQILSNNADLGSLRDVQIDILQGTSQFFQGLIADQAQAAGSGVAGMKAASEAKPEQQGNYNE